MFYVQRCYRYERPQAGRYREFTQCGVEVLGHEHQCSRDEIIADLRHVLDMFGVEYAINTAVKRGLSYYTEDGFEAECPSLGAPSALRCEILDLFQRMETAALERQEVGRALYRHFEIVAGMISRSRAGDDLSDLTSRPEPPDRTTE